MRGKNAAFLWTIFHSIGDILEEKILLKFNENQYFFWMSLVSGIFSIILALIVGINMTFLAFLILIIYSLALIGGDYCYGKAIQTLPIGLANLIDSGSLFLVLLCDIFLGYIKPKLIFLIIFFIFFGAIYVFSYETNKMKAEIKNKEINLKNIFILITATIFYTSEPYFIKLASSKGADEYGINFVYSIISIIVFYFLYKRDQKNIKPLVAKDKKEFSKTIILLGFIYTLTSLLNMFAYTNDTPILISLIMKLQLFFVVIISTIRKTDKMNVKKVVSLIVGVICIALMTFIS